MKLPTATRFMMQLFALLALVATAYISRMLYFGQIKFYYLFIPVGIVFFYYTLIVVAFKTESKQSIKDIIRLLNAKILYEF